MRATTISMMLGLILNVSMAQGAAATTNKSTAVGAWIDCLMKAAIRLDDHTSDASVIAAGIISQCTQLYETSAELFARGMSPGAAAIFRSKDRERQLKFALTAVLKERAGEIHRRPDTR